MVKNDEKTTDDIITGLCADGMQCEGPDLDI